MLSTLAASFAVASARLRIMSRYPGSLVFNLVLPIIIAGIPILTSRAVGGTDAAARFAARAGTPEYVAYLLLGANVYTVITNTLWFVGNWMRREQETGTLEALYLAPLGRGWMLAGTAFAGGLRALGTAIVAFVIGCLLFGANPLQGNILLALVFMVVGLVPMFGLALLYGAAVLRIKEATALINMLQWAIGFLMGVFYPVAVFPPLLRAVALLFPPTWMNNGVRSAVLGVGYFFGTWYLDLAVLAAFALLMPRLGTWLFALVERSLKRNEGIGQF